MMYNTYMYEKMLQKVLGHEHKSVSQWALPHHLITIANHSHNSSAMLCQPGHHLSTNPLKNIMKPVKTVRL